MAILQYTDPFAPIGGGIPGVTPGAGSQEVTQGTNQGASQGTSQGSSAGSSSTYLPPEKIAAYNSLMGFLKNPGAGMSEAIATTLETLIPSEDRARANLTEQFRAAGQLGSGAFAQAARQGESDILRNRQSAASDIGLKYLSPMISGYGTGLTGIPALSESSQAASNSSQQSAQNSGQSSGQKIGAVPQAPGVPSSTGGGGTSPGIPGATGRTAQQLLGIMPPNPFEGQTADVDWSGYGGPPAPDVNEWGEYGNQENFVKDIYG